MLALLQGVALGCCSCLVEDLQKQALATGQTGSSDETLQADTNPHACPLHARDRRRPVPRQFARQAASHLPGGAVMRR